MNHYTDDDLIDYLDEEGEGVLCSSSPGRHDVVHLNEAVFRVDADA